MAIYIIADLHLSLNHSKPMNIFGSNWEKHEEKIKKDWEKRVNENDTILILGDFSWETYLEDTYNDFEYINSLPGKKILLKGNHDYWWTTVTNIRNYLKENSFNTIDILFNNSYEIGNYLIAGTRGWDYSQITDRKIIDREINRLKISLDSAKQINSQKEIIVCMHYPPISKNYINNEFEMKIINILKEYNVEKCFYGHLHGAAHQQAITRNIDGIEFYLTSADYLDFKLLKME